MITKAKAKRRTRKAELIRAAFLAGLGPREQAALVRFGLAYDREVERYAERQGQFRWVTIGAEKSNPPGEKGGAKVKIDNKGRIGEGPAGLKGKTIGELDKDVAGTPQDKRRQAEPPDPPEAKPKAKPISTDPNKPDTFEFKGQPLEFYQRGNMLFYRKPGKDTGWLVARVEMMQAIVDQVRKAEGEATAPRPEPETKPKPPEPKEPERPMTVYEKMSERGARTAAAEKGVDIDWDKVPLSQWEDWTRRIPFGSQIVNEAIAMGYERKAQAAEEEEKPPEVGQKPSDKQTDQQTDKPKPEEPAGVPASDKDTDQQNVRPTPQSKHWDPVVRRLQDQSRAYAQREGVEIAWDKIPDDTWDFWGQQGLVPGQVVSRALQEGYGPDDSGQAGEGSDDRPGLPGSAEDEPGGRFKLTNSQAEPTASDTPRKSAGQAQRKLDENYEFARASAVGNKGEDLKGSARHKINAWRNLEQAERDGTAEELTNRATLEKAEPHTYSDFVNSNPVGALAAHLAMKKFPSKPGYGSARRLARRDEETKKRDRANFVEAYQNLQQAIGDAAKAHDDPGDLLDAMKQAVRNEIERLRDPNREGGYQNRFDNTANALVRMSDALSRYSRFKTSVKRQLEDFGQAISERYSDVSPADRLERTADHALDVIEKGGLGKLTGQAGGKRGEVFKPADMYVKKARREGGRELTTKTPDATTDHMVNSMKFRGIQFGNTMTDDERQHHAAKASEAMMDLADLMGLQDADMSLGGRLGLAFGARGHGTALAHYEPASKQKGGVINITRKGGVGALAHEWGHALDHQMTDHEGYMSEDHQATHEIYRKDDPSKVVNRVRAGARPSSNFGIRPAKDNTLRQAYTGWKTASRDFQKRLSTVLRHMVANKMMSSKRAEYWNSGREVFARTFERWTQQELRGKGRENTYLTGLGTEGASEGSLWPTDAEVEQMAPAFREIAQAYANSDIRSRLKKEGDYALRLDQQLASLEKFASWSDSCPGVWRTLGSDKSNPPGEKGGARVCIGSDGTIKAGPKALKGRKITSLDRNVSGTSEDKRKQAEPPLTEQKRRELLVDIGFQVQTGRANPEAEQALMRRLGTDDFGQVARLVKQADDKTLQDVHRIVTEDAEAQRRRLNKQQRYEPENDPQAIAEQAYKTKTNIWRLMREMGIRQEDRKKLGPQVAKQLTALHEAAAKPSEARRRAQELRQKTDQEAEASLAEGAPRTSEAAGSVRHPRAPEASPRSYDKQASQWRLAQAGGDWHSDESIGAKSYLTPKAMRKAILDRGSIAQALGLLAEKGRLSDGRFWLDLPDKARDKLQGIAQEAYQQDVERAKSLGKDPGEVPDPAAYEERALGLAKTIEEYAGSEVNDEPAERAAYRDPEGHWADMAVVAMQGEHGKTAAYDRQYIETIQKAHPTAQWFMPWDNSKPIIAKKRDGTVVGGVMPLDKGDAGLRDPSPTGSKPILIEPNETRMGLEEFYEPAPKPFEVELGKQHSVGGKQTFTVTGTNWGEGQRWIAHAQKGQDGWALHAGAPHAYRESRLLGGPFNSKRSLGKAIEDLKRFATGADGEGRPTFSVKASPSTPKPAAKPQAKMKRPTVPDAGKLTPRLKQAIGQWWDVKDQADIEGLHGFVKDAHKLHVEDAQEANQQMLNLLGQFGYNTPQKISGLIRRVKRAQDPESAGMPKNFDQMWMMAEKDYPRTLGVQTGESEVPNPEEALFQKLKAGGLTKILSPWDEEILGQANEMIPVTSAGGAEQPDYDPGSGGFDDYEPEGAGAEDDEDYVPFSAQASGAAQRG